MRCNPLRVSQWRRGQLTLCVLLLASPAMAEPGQPESVPVPLEVVDVPSDAVVNVTWSDLVQLVNEHPRLAAGRHRVEAARRGVDVAGAVPNPTLEGDVGRGFARAGNASRTEWGLALTMPLGWISQRRARMNAAQAEVDVAQAESAALRRDVLVQLRMLYWDLAYQQARVESLEALEAQTSTLVRTVEQRVEKGEARPVEATRVQIELQRVTGELEAARLALPARQAELALWLRIPRGKTLVAQADLDTLPAAIALDVALSRARALHPARAVANARTRALQADVRAEKSVRVPAFSVTGFTAYELDRRGYGVGLTVDVPLWNWNSGRIAQAEARVAAAQKEAEATSLEVDASVIEAEAACRSSLSTTIRFRDNMVPRSEAAATTIEKTYQLGEASLLEVIDARRTLLDSRSLYLRALAQAQIDCSRLGALVGEEPK